MYEEALIRDVKENLANVFDRIDEIATEEQKIDFFRLYLEGLEIGFQLAMPQRLIQPINDIQRVLSEFDEGSITRKDAWRRIANILL